jgi:3-hydroxybutyryl-CoA dehydrogenase
MFELGEIGRERVEFTLAQIQFTTDLKQAAQEVDYVLEAVFENLDLKKRIFQQLGTYTPSHAILSSNTSSFDINELSAVTVHPERVVGTHWFHPPQITPCVEVIPSKSTSQQTITSTMNFMERIGKLPTLCKSAPGFVGNRIQFAMATEALAIVDEGLATPEEVDRIVKTSFGFRLGAYGPFEICDQAGLDIYRSVYEYLYSKLNKEQFKPPKILDKLIKQGRLGLKTQSGFYEYKEDAVEAMKRERDRKLYARLRLFREEQKAEKVK